MLFASLKSLARHTAIYSLGDILGRAIGVLLLPLYARLLSTGENGVRDLVFTFIAFSAVFYSLGLNQALVRYISGKDDPEARKRRFSTAFATLAGLGLLLSALIWRFAGPLSHLILDAPGYADLFRLIAGIVLLDVLVEPLFALCRAQQRSVAFSTVKLLQNTLQMGLTVYLIAGLGYGVHAVFWSNLASSAFALCALLPLCLSSLRPVYSLRTARELFAFGLPFVPSALAALLIELSDRFLIRHFLGLETAGVYGIAYKLGLPMLLIVRAFRSAWAPAVLAETRPEDARALCARVTTYFSAAAVFFCLGAYAFARDLIRLIAGDEAPEYVIGADVVPLVTLAYLFYGLYVILTAGVYAETRPRTLPAVVGAGAAINIGINLVLIPRIGFIAAAWSTLIAYAGMAGLLFLCTRRFYPVPYEYGRLAKIDVAGLAIFLAVSGYQHDPSPAGTAARGIFLLGYPCILWGWHFFEPRELQHLASIVRFPRHRTET